MRHTPDLIAAVKAETLDLYGQIIPDVAADAALTWVHRWPPVDPAHHAAVAALGTWRAGRRATTTDGARRVLAG